MENFDLENKVSESDITEDIEIDGERFHIEKFEPTVEEYRELVSGLYKSFFDNDIKNAVDSALDDSRASIRSELEAEMQKREEDIRNEIKKEILKKISQRRLRPDENGVLGHASSHSRDVSKMTKEERAAAAKKAAGGLLINFK